MVNGETIRAMKHNHDRVNAALTDFGVTTVVNVFAFVGFICVCSLAVVSIGLRIDAIANPVVHARGGWIEQNNKNSTCEAQITVHFAGYSSWDEMMENCCCRDVTREARRFLAYGDRDPIQTEEWVCRNGLQKRIPRMEIANGHINNFNKLLNDGQIVEIGYNFVSSTIKARSFCSREFNPGWYLAPRCGVRYFDNSLDQVFLGHVDDTIRNTPIDWNSGNIQPERNDLWKLREGLW